MPSSLRERIELASADLVYSSESDCPFTFRHFPGVAIPVAQLTPKELGSLAGALGADVTELSLDEFFARHIERVDTQDVQSQHLIPRYELFRDLLKRSLGAIRVFRLGKIEVRCLVLGNDPATGEIAGVETVAIET